MSVPEIILELVERFRLHNESYKASTYNETQLRREFADPFFGALGWDIDNEHGYAEAYKDVIHEDAIKIGGYTKAPDYAFRIGGTRKFFLETKRPSVNIRSDIHPAYQLRRYAWSAKLGLSILTDFEEFAVYDCRIRPEKGDKASVARVAYYTYDQYPDKWDEIASIFSREAILKGSFDKYADDNKRKRGTSEVDDAFLLEIENWRVALAKNIARRNPNIFHRDLNTAVQRTIDRIIFLRIAEDRGIEKYGQLQAIAKGQGVYDRLADAFKRADDRYNSGLFHFRKGDGSSETLDSFTLGLSIDDKVLRPILQAMYYPESPYEFSVLPPDILGQVYERFLGKVIRLSGRQAVIEEKPDVKKAGGVYYTPTYVVSHIVGETLGALLRGISPAQAGGLDKRSKNPLPLRILDPACGSGSFLIEAYQYLLDWYRDWYIRDGVQKHSKGKEPKLQQVAKDAYRLTISERRRILLTHIYGVDIDSQAVEVTKLSLLLKVLEGETADDLARQMDFFKIRALPDLGKNIRCGNSLIESDLYEQYSLADMDAEERVRVNVFDWAREFPFLKTAGGFDTIIGNPPYLYSAAGAYSTYFDERYALSQYQTDFYVFFVEKALGLLRAGGYLGFITPDSWLNSQTFSKLRNALVTQWRLKQVCTFDYKVFRDANIENVIFVTQRHQPEKTFEVRTFHSPTSVSPPKSLEVEDVVRQGMIDARFNPEAEVIIRHLDAFEKLKRFAKVNRGIHAYRTDGYGRSAFGPGAQTKRDKEERSYHSRTRKNATYLPEIRGRDVGWMSYEGSGEYVSYGDWLAEPRDPQFIRSPKAVFRKTLGRVLSVALIEEPAAVDQSLYIAIDGDNDTERLKFIIGVTGSSLGAWFLRTKYAIYDRLHPWYTKKQLDDFPLPVFTPSIPKLVDGVRESCRQLAAAVSESERRRIGTELEAQRRILDNAVFSAFKLSPAQQNFILSAVADGAPLESE